jgi:hypothetical protein
VTRFLGLYLADAIPILLPKQGRLVPTAVVVMQINAAAPPGVAGAVNGAGQAVSSLMRALGPFLGGFAWSLSISIRVPGHQFLVFVCISMVAFLYQFVYSFVDLPDLDT